MGNAVPPLDDAYFEWLYSQVAVVKNRNPARSYWNLLKQLYTRQFHWFVPNDDNRAADGKDLRIEFLHETNYPLEDPYHLFMDAECSILEMLIALARAAAFQMDEDPMNWFWRMLHNLEMDRYTDDLYEISIQEEVEMTLDRLNQRTYAEDGTGGLFPLRQANHDQRRVELWYQLSAYLLEGWYRNIRPRV